jgi:hypothetical protein
MKQTRRKVIDTRLGLTTLLAGTVISVLTLAYATISPAPLIQTAALLVSMGLLFYSSHPLGHYFVARIFGIRVDYFFLGRSEFRRLEIASARMIGNVLPTVGTKLNSSELESLAPRTRGYILGSGVIVSITLVGIQLAYSLVAGFGFLAVLLGTIFFVGSLGTEIIFGTKVGDLSKMKAQFRVADSGS